MFASTTFDIRTHPSVWGAVEFATKRKRNISYALLKLQLAATGFVYYRNRLGLSMAEAVSCVAEAYSAPEDTVRDWVKDLKGRSPNEARAFQRIRGRGRSRANAQKSIGSVEANDREFGDAAMQRAGNEFRSLRN